MIKGFFVVTILLFTTLDAFAVEVAPRISDREIIESLVELKAGQKALEEIMDQRFESMDKRFESMETNFNQRFGFLESLLMVIIAGIFGLIGYIVWDRKTALRPLEKRMHKLESELHRDLASNKRTPTFFLTLGLYRRSMDGRLVDIRLANR